MTASVPTDPANPSESFSLAGASFERREAEGCTVVEAAGEIDIAVAPLLRDILAGGRSAFVVLDLSKVEFLDSTGLAALVECWREAPARGGWLRLVNPRGPALKVLQLTGTDQVLPVHDTVEEALQLRIVESAGAAAPASDAATAEQTHA